MIYDIKVLLVSLFAFLLFFHVLQNLFIYFLFVSYKILNTIKELL